MFFNKTIIIKKLFSLWNYQRSQNFHFEKNLVKLFQLSKYNKKNILTIIENVKPNEVYNLSGLSSVAKSFKKSKETFISIVETNSYILEILTKNKNIKYYNACSSECFGDTGNESANEKTKFKPCSPYAIAKSTAYWTSNMYRKVHNIYACSGILFNHESHIRPNYFVTKKIISSAYRISRGSTKNSN